MMKRIMEVRLGFRLRMWVALLLEIPVAFALSWGSHQEFSFLNGFAAGMVAAPLFMLLIFWVMWPRVVKEEKP